MCTVSYLPLGSGRNGKQGGRYILTSNRDEAPHRNAIEFRHHEAEGVSLYFPVDPYAGGTWFCISTNHRAACLLNGAHHPFAPGSQYTQSRGIALLELMQCETVEAFIGQYDLSFTAPFTIVMAESDNLHELIWDGTKAEWTMLDPEVPAFWSSVTLYPQDVRSWRKQLFDKWVTEHPVFEQKQIMDFHRYGSGDDIWNGFVMNRDEQVKTLSISSVMKHDTYFSIVHADLTSGHKHQETLKLNPLYAAKT